ncbi:PepSY domain-containing protein [Streptomyces sp. NPDC059743]|uniref:PepSY domain-containing protein n=1 Tax=Streptomyces sp. NPDC059743 TaxID=3346928 RepID=UPI00364DCA4C
MKRNLVIAAITAAALIGGGTYTAVAMGGDDGTADPGTPPAPVSQLASSDDSPSPRVSRADLTAGQAADAALKKVPGTVTSVERDDDRTGRWEVDVRGKDGRIHELNIHARTGKVTPDRTDDRGDDHGGRHGDGRDDDGRDD